MSAARYSYQRNLFPVIWILTRKQTPRVLRHSQVQLTKLKFKFGGLKRTRTSDLTLIRRAL